MIWSGAACRPRKGLIADVWQNNVETIVEPLRRSYDVRLFGWFEAPPSDCDVHVHAARHCACQAAIRRLNFSSDPKSDRRDPLTRWDELTFSDDLGVALPRGTALEKYAAIRRYAALRRWVWPSLDRQGLILLLRPDLWFRQPVTAWGLLDGPAADVAVPHRECPGLSCGGAAKRQFMAPEAFYALSPRAVQLLMLKRLESALSRFNARRGVGGISPDARRRCGSGRRRGVAAAPCGAVGSRRRRAAP